MRGIPSLITDIRKKVFTEVARMAYSGNGYEGAEDLPFKIVPGDQPLHRESIFLERAIAGERVRLAMGLSIRPVQTRSLMTEGMDAAAIAEQLDIEIDRRRVELGKPIKMTGTYQVPVSLYRDIKGTVTVVVAGESEAEEAIDAIEEAIDIAETPADEMVEVDGEVAADGTVEVEVTETEE